MSTLKGYEMDSDVKWLMIMLAALAFSGAVAAGVYFWSESRTSVACIESGGQWLDTEPDDTVTMGCARP